MGALGTLSNVPKDIRMGHGNTLVDCSPTLSLKNGIYQSGILVQNMLAYLHTHLLDS